MIKNLKKNDSGASNTYEYSITTDKNSEEQTRKIKNLYINFISNENEKYKVDVSGAVEFEDLHLNVNESKTIMNINLDSIQYREITQSVVNNISNDMNNHHVRHCKYCDKTVSEANWAKHCKTLKHNKMNGVIDELLNSDFDDILNDYITKDQQTNKNK